MLSLLHQIAGRPWAIRSDIALHVRALIAREGFAGLRHLAELKAAMHEPRVEARLGSRPQVSGNVAVIPLIGTMTQRGDVINSVQTASTAAFAETVAAGAAEPKVDALVLEIDSGGGEVLGVPEAWLAVREAARIKPVVAHANSVMASAALYVGSAAAELWVTPSGEAGSVGVYALHADESKALEAEGIALEFIVADDSPLKVEGNPFEPLSESGRAMIQRAVNRYMGMFARDLARGRRVSVEHVRTNFGQGRMLSPQEAVNAKMADAVGTLDQAIARAAELGREKRRGSIGMAARASESGTYLESLNPTWTPAPAAGVNDAPNLREGTEGSACQNCEHFSQPSAAIPRGPCSRYDFTTETSWLCDGWEADEEEPKPEQEPDAAPEPTTVAAEAVPAEPMALVPPGPTPAEQAAMEAARTRARLL